MFRKLRLAMAVMAATLVAGLGLLVPSSASSGGFEPSAGLRGVGVMDHRLMSENSEESRRAMTLVKETGFSTVRIHPWWNGTAVPDSYQLQGVCNAVRNLLDNGLTNIVISPTPRRWNWPKTDAERELFVQSMGAYNRYLFREGGCVNGRPITIQWMPVNEPNIVTFCDPLAGDDVEPRHSTCADWSARLMHRVYEFVQEEERRYGVEMPVVGLGLGSHHSPFHFLEKLGEARKRLGYKEPDMDKLGFHPYALNGSRDHLSGIKMTPRLKEVIRSVFGQAVKITYSEFGIETKSPADKPYQGSTPISVLLVDEAELPYLIDQVLKMANRYGVESVIFFMLCDEATLNPGFQSGAYYLDCSPKESLPGIIKAFKGEFWSCFLDLSLLGRPSFTSTFACI